MKYLGLDVETKNLGSDVMKDNEQLLSLQIGDDKGQRLYWADSPDSGLTLKAGKKEIMSLLSEDTIFVGYNIENFDNLMLNDFLGIQIPQKNLIDLCFHPKVVKIKGSKKMRLEEVCNLCGIDAGHKNKMNKHSLKFYSNKEIITQAEIAAKKLVNAKGWSPDFCRKISIEKLAGGHAIFDAYQEFVKSGGRQDTLFYEYAIGDIISEYKLFELTR
jgi:hypothetical protein